MEKENQDEFLRMTALNFSLDYFKHQGPDDRKAATAEGVIADANTFYDFLKGE